MQVQLRRGALLSVGEVERGLRIFKEDMSAGVGTVEVEKTEGQLRVAAHQGRGQPVRRLQSEAAPVAVCLEIPGQKHCHARHQQCLRQPAGDGVEQVAQVGLCAEFPSEADEGFAVIVAFAVKQPVYTVLDGALDRIEQRRSDDDGGDQPVHAGIGQALAHQLGGQCHQAEIKAQQRRRGQRVRYAALEDQVHIHEAVAHDGPGKGQRQDDKREDGQVAHRFWRGPVKQVRQDVEQRVGNHGQQGPARKPLELLTPQHLTGCQICLLAGAQVLDGEQGSGQDVEGIEVGRGELVKAVREQPCSLPTPQRVQLQPYHHGGRQVGKG